MHAASTPYYQLFIKHKRTSQLNASVRQWNIHTISITSHWTVGTALNAVNEGPWRRNLQETVRIHGGGTADRSSTTRNATRRPPPLKAITSGLERRQKCHHLPSVPHSLSSRDPACCRFMGQSADWGLLHPDNRHACTAGKYVRDAEYRGSIPSLVNLPDNA